MTIEPPHILVIDDELTICRNCIKILAKSDYAVDYALDGYQGLEKLESHPVDLVITDLKMSRLGGMEVLRRVRAEWPDMMVIVITGFSTVSSAVEVMKTGAFDYLPKPFTPDELRAVVAQALVERQIRLQNRQLTETGLPQKPPSHQLIGNSAKIKHVITMIGKVAPTDSTVLICGESGTGKELVARAVHANSRRRDAVFFAVDCGTLTGNLLESELFGHVKGAFTGAHRNKAGIFEQAHHGTVFLDEISNISLEVQGKLLRFLECREFLPRGAATPRKVDIRLIFATNQSLEEMVDAGTFRPDFYYRIFVYPIFIPPLCERQSDILPIAYHFLNQLRRKMNRPAKHISPEAAARLIEYDWPGNVRQLRNVIERAVILCEDLQIKIADLPMLADSADLYTVTESVPQTNAELKRMKKRIRRQAVAQIEKAFIQHALNRHDWNVTRAAKATGMQRPNFQNMMKKHGISLPQSV